MATYRGNIECRMPQGEPQMMEDSTYDYNEPGNLFDDYPDPEGEDDHENG